MVSYLNLRQVSMGAAVLILIVVDNGLVLYVHHDYTSYYPVLILIVVDNGLVQFTNNLIIKAE